MCLGLHWLSDLLLSWLPGYYIGKIFAFVFLFLDNKLAKYSLKALQQRISTIDLAIDEISRVSGSWLLWMLIGPLRFHLRVVFAILTQFLPEHLGALEELYEKEGKDTKPDFKVPISYPELLKLPMTPRTHSRVAPTTYESSKYLVKMNIRSATADASSLRFFPYLVWTSNHDFFWQAEGDNLLQSDQIVKLMSSDDAKLSIRLKLAKSVKVINCARETCYRELLDKLK